MRVSKGDGESAGKGQSKVNLSGTQYNIVIDTVTRTNTCIPTAASAYLANETGIFGLGELEKGRGQVRVKVV